MLAKLVVVLAVATAETLSRDESQLDLRKDLVVDGLLELQFFLFAFDALGVVKRVLALVAMPVTNVVDGLTLSAVDPLNWDLFAAE